MTNETNPEPEGKGLAIAIFIMTIGLGAVICILATIIFSN